jgi:hypothetical protein
LAATMLSPIEHSVSSRKRLAVDFCTCLIIAVVLPE